MTMRRHRGGGGKLTSSSSSSSKTKKTKTNDSNSDKEEAINGGSSTTTTCKKKSNKNDSLYRMLGGMATLLVVAAATLVAAIAVAIFISSSSSSPSTGKNKLSAADQHGSADVVANDDEQTHRPAMVVKTQPVTQQQQTTRFGRYQLLERVPHDAQAFTQGLEMRNATHYYESLGLYGESSVRMVQLSTGKAVLETPIMDGHLFGEGLTRYSVHPAVAAGPKNDGQEQLQEQQERIIQITWMEKVAFIYDADTLQEVQRMTYDTSTGQGWGIAFDTVKKNILYMTDGSSLLHTFHVPAADHDDADDTDPQQDAMSSTKMTECRPRVEVYMVRGENSIPIHNLNELEYDDTGGGGGTLLANVWHQDVLVRIHPDTGFVPIIYNLQSLYPQDERPASADVLNGIALVHRLNGSSCSDSRRRPGERSEVWVTGKKWPWMYRILLLDDE